MSGNGSSPYYGGEGQGGGQYGGIEGVGTVGGRIRKQGWAVMQQRLVFMVGGSGGEIGFGVGRAAL